MHTDINYHWYHRVRLHPHVADVHLAVQAQVARAAGHGLGMGAGERRPGPGQGEQGDAKTRLDSHVGIR